MTVLVTGGAGYVGSHVVRQLENAGETVVVLDNLTHGHRAAVAGTRLVEGDIRDRALLERLLDERKVQAVVHLAASKSVEESLRRPGEYFRNNVVGSLELLEACTRAGVRHFVFSSTCALYGTPSSLPIDEEAAPQPETPYGESKLLVERMLRWFDVAHGLRYVSLRYFNAAGAADEGDIGEDWEGATTLIPRVMRASLGKSGPVTVYGTDYPTQDGTAVRDYTHVLDLADAHQRSLVYLRDGGSSEILNLGTGLGTSVRQIVDATARLSGRAVPHVLADRRPGDPPAVWADPSKAHSVLGWTATRTLDDIISSAWRWHSAHPDGFRTG
jgi:UDP-glucose 4-epimerase